MLAEKWEQLITKKHIPTTILSSLTVHRITGSKSTTIFLHRLNVRISCNDLRLITNYWPAVSHESSEVGFLLDFYLVNLFT